MNSLTILLLDRWQELNNPPRYGGTNSLTILLLDRQLGNSAISSFPCHALLTLFQANTNLISHVASGINRACMVVDICICQVRRLVLGLAAVPTGFFLHTAPPTWICWSILSWMIFPCTYCNASKRIAHFPRIVRFIIIYWQWQQQRYAIILQLQDGRRGDQVVHPSL